MGQTFVAAAAQLTSKGDVSANLQQCHELASEAADKGAQLFVLPECFAMVGTELKDRLKIAETPGQGSGPITTAIQEMAATHKLWVIAGGFPEWTPAGPTESAPPYNTCAAVSPSGDIVARYRKMHLFDIDIPGRAQLTESDVTTRGDELVTVDTGFCTVGLSICYDLRFPEFYRKLVLDEKADVVVVPAAFTAHTGAAHWHTLLRARAIENQCFVLAAGQTGRHHEKRASYGHSIIYDPWGDTLAEKPDGTGLALATLSLERIKEIREQLPCGQHARLSH